MIYATLGSQAKHGKLGMSGAPKNVPIYKKNQKEDKYGGMISIGDTLAGVTLGQLICVGEKKKRVSADLQLS